MSIHVSIMDGPLPADAPAWSDSDTGRSGAVLRFEGVVRAHEEGSKIAALDYEAYEPMASRQLEQLSAEIIREFDLHGVFVEHSRGRVPVGRCSFRLRILSAHRKAGLQAMDRFIDHLKRDVPIWKAPVWSTDHG